MLSNGLDRCVRLLSRSGFSALSFSPDSLRIAAGFRDTSIVVWDLYPSVGKRKPIEKLWEDLASSREGMPYPAMGQMISRPEKTVAWLATHLKPRGPLGEKRAMLNMARLSSRSFIVREKAVHALGAMGNPALPWLRGQLKRRHPIGALRHLKEVIRRLEARTAASDLQHIYAIQVLEKIGTNSAHSLLEALAKGDSTAVLTREARLAVDIVQLK